MAIDFFYYPLAYNIGGSILKELGGFANMTLGLRIKTLRNNKKMTQVQPARLAGVSQATVSDYERDQVPNPRSNELMRIAAVLETTPEFLVSGEGPEHISNQASDHQALVDAFNKLPDASAALIAAAQAMAIK